MWERVESWRVTFADGAPGSELRELLQALESGTPEGAEVAKASKLRRVFRVALGDEQVFVKRDLRSGRASRARLRREFRNLERVRAWGLPAVDALCMAEREQDAVLITRAVPGARPLTSAPEATTEVGHVVRRLHDAGGWHRDLHRGNVLVGPDGPVLIDLQKLVALPIAVPWFLRVRDLAMLVGRKARDSAALLSAYDAERPSLEARVQRASERRWQTRLRSRGRRCVLPSSGFRVERSGNLRVYRRADVELDTVLAGIAGSLRGDVAGGPAAGPAPDPFARGQGALEPGAPSSGPVGVHEYRGSVLPWIVPSRGMRAWRGAHALLLRGFQTLTPLALVEERRFGGTRRAWLLTRDESIDPLFDSRDPVSRSARARLAARALGALHESGLRFARFDSRALGVRPIAPDAVVVRAADEIRTGAVSVSARSRELERLASDLDEPDRVEQGRLLVSYRESGSAAEAAWCRAFPEAASSR